MIWQDTDQAKIVNACQREINEFCNKIENISGFKPNLNGCKLLILGNIHNIHTNNEAKSTLLKSPIPFCFDSEEGEAERIELMKMWNTKGN